MRPFGKCVPTLHEVLNAFDRFLAYVEDTHACVCIIGVSVVCLSACLVLYASACVRG